MSTAALEATMVGVEAARVALETATSRVVDELSQLQEQVLAANTKAIGERLHIAAQARKRRRRSGGAGGAAAAAAQGDHPDAAAGAAFEQEADVVDERLQDVRCAIARAHAATQAVRAAVDG